MIKLVAANKRGFHTVEFAEGVNLILADRSKIAGDKDTTNALGKSTLIEIIDFCLGSNANKGKGLRVEALAGWSFTIVLTLNRSEVRVTRSTDEPNFFIIEGNTDDWPHKPEMKGEYSGLDAKRWRSVLGWALFGLSREENINGYKASARSLLSYFTRNQPSAYVSPFKYFDSQKTWEVQLYNAFLLGLDWEKAGAWQKLKDQTNALSALKTAIKTGAVDGELASIGELEAERVNLSGRFDQERKALSDFRVLPQFREIEMEANSLTETLHALLNANVSDKRRLKRYRDSISDEANPSTERLEALYAEAGVKLPGAVTKTLQEAKRFNEQIIANRREFIAAEISSIEDTIDAREIELEAVSRMRAELLSLMAGQGALEELTGLQGRHAETKLKITDLENRINQIRQMTTRADDIKLETVDLKRRATLDHEERRKVWSKALALFSEFSERLYNLPGQLVIDIDETGYRFGVEIAGSPSEGISKMKIFCYDLMLISFARERGLGIDFLVHDSTVFDGVDPRQRAHAIELAVEMSKKFGFQYICTLNTDMVPTKDFSEDFDFARLIKLRLTDTDPSGSLLGFRY